MLGTSDAWSMSHLSQQTSVLYCRLSDFCCCALPAKTFISIFWPRPKFIHTTSSVKEKHFQQKCLENYVSSIDNQQCEAGSNVSCNSQRYTYKPDCSLSYSGFFHMYDLGVSYTFHFHKKMQNHP